MKKKNSYSHKSVCTIYSLKFLVKISPPIRKPRIKSIAIRIIRLSLANFSRNMNNLTTRPAAVQLHRAVYERHRFLSFENFNSLFGLITGGTRVPVILFYSRGQYREIYKTVRAALILRSHAARRNCLLKYRPNAYTRLADTTESQRTRPTSGSLARYDDSKARSNRPP